MVDPRLAASGRPRPSLTVNLGHLPASLVAEPGGLPALAASVERWGADQVLLGEHLFLGDDMGHPGSTRGSGARFPWPPTEPFPDPFVTLAALAASTNHVRLASIVIAPLHQPVALAKRAATLDVLSGGRFELGLVAGWYEPEFRASGVALDERFARLEETVAVCRLLWTGAPVAYDGRWSSFSGAVARPAPLAGAALPIWLGGGTTPVNVRRVARLADGWMASETLPIEQVPAAVHAVRSGCAEHGRDPDTLAVRVTVPPPGRWTTIATHQDTTVGIAERAAELVAAGVTHIGLPLAAFATAPSQAEKVISEVRAALDGG
jgi:probable F420-dependent oxidoreductase